MRRWLVLLGFAAIFAQLVYAEGDILAAPGGRYVFGQISAYRSDQYLLDTQTGRLWQIAIGSDSVLSLSPIHFDSLRVTDGVGLRFRSTAPFGNEITAHTYETPRQRMESASARQANSKTFNAVLWLISGAAAALLVASVTVGND